MNPIIVDYETYYKSHTKDGKDKYTLRQLSMWEYVHDERFLLHMGGYYDLRRDEYTRCDGWDDNRAYVEEKFCAGSGNTLFAHNAAFDGTILRRLLGGDVAVPVHCTMAMARAVLGNNIGSHSLDAVAQHLGIGRKQQGVLIQTDGLRVLPPEVRDQLASYMRDDVMLCAMIVQLLTARIPLPHWRTMQWANEIFINPRLRLDDVELHAAGTAEKARIDAAMATVPYSRTAVRSNQQLIQIFTELDVKVPTKISPTTKKRTAALSKADPEFVTLQHHKDPRVAALVKCRLAVKTSIEETRIESLLSVASATPEALWPVHEKASGTHTHRPTGGNGGGGNPLNFGRTSSIRDAIKPRHDDMSVLAFDYTGAELRITRFMVGDMPAIWAIERDSDLYVKFMAENVLEQAPRERWVKGDIPDDDRFVGKQLQLSLQYLVGTRTMLKRLRVAGVDVTESEVQRMVDVFRKKAHKALPKWWYGMGSDILGMMVDGRADEALDFGPYGPEGLRVKGNKIFLPSGRWLEYPHIHQQGREFKYVNYAYAARKGNQLQQYLARPESWSTPPAGVQNIYGGSLLENLAQTLTNEVIDPVRSQLHKELKDFDPRAGVAMEVYDELVCVVPTDSVDDWSDYIHDMAVVSPEWWQCLPLDIESNSGRTLSEAK